MAGHIHVERPWGEDFHVLEEEGEIALALSEDLIEGLLVLHAVHLFIEAEGEVRVELHIELRLQLVGDAAEELREIVSEAVL